MRYSFRLAELLGHSPDPRKRPGTIKSIVEYTGLDRHQVSALLKNEVKYIPLQALSRLCDYLIEQGHTTADQLPGALFAVEAEDFWEVLARRNRLELCVGVRREEDLPESAWVVAADSVLLGELLNGVSTLGGTAKARYGAESSAKPHPTHLKQSLVWSPGQMEEAEVQDCAREVYDGFHNAPGDKALVCLGSVKSNPVVELIMAASFGSEPYVSQDGIAAAAERRCPIYFRFRQHDPQFGSCSGGLHLAEDTPTERPGIYYETKDGNWDLCEWDEPEQDAALVFYVHRESQGCLEMALAGFSGRSTRLLAKTLANRAQDFWPPVYQSHGLQVGAYIVKYNLVHHNRARDMLRTDLTANMKVIPLDEEVIARRIALR